MNRWYYALLLFGLQPVTAAVELKTEEQKISYAMGAYFAAGIQQQAVDLDLPAFMQAVEDQLKGAKLLIPEAEMQAILVRYQAKLTQQIESANTANQQAGEQFLAENKKQKSVIELPSGLQYKIIRTGEGEQPKPHSKVTVHYHGTLIDGTVFDSSYDRGEPVSFALDQVIRGWQEALPMMKIGSKWQIYVPAKLAYGDRGAGKFIRPGAALIFDIELLSIN